MLNDVYASWYIPLWRVSYIVIAKAAEVLATQEATTSEAMVLNYLPQNIPVSA